MKLFIFSVRGKNHYVKAKDYETAYQHILKITHLLK